MIAIDLEGNGAIEESSQMIDKVFIEVAKRLEGRKYLCGDSLTAADIAFASLCYPIVAAALPDVWDARFPRLEKFPENYKQQITAWMNTPAGKHAIFIYREHRFKNTSTSKQVRITNPNSRNNFWPLIVLAGAGCALTAALISRSRL